MHFCSAVKIIMFSYFSGIALATAVKKNKKKNSSVIIATAAKKKNNSLWSRIISFSDYLSYLFGIIISNSKAIANCDGKLGMWSRKC